MDTAQITQAESCTQNKGTAAGNAKELNQLLMLTSVTTRFFEGVSSSSRRPAPRTLYSCSARQPQLKQCAHNANTIMAIPSGIKAPDFSLKTKTAEGLQDIKLSDNIGHRNTVLLFFPLAFTGVCTKEMCDISGGLKAYADLNAQVIGISVDSPFAQEAWAQKEHISVALASDLNKEVSKAYDVLLPDLVGIGSASARAAFVIDKEGIVRYSEQTPTPLELPSFDLINATLAQLQ